MSQDPFAGSLPRDVGFFDGGATEGLIGLFLGRRGNRKRRSGFPGEARAT